MLSRSISRAKTTWNITLLEKGHQTLEPKNTFNPNFWHTVYQSVAGRILSKVAFVVVLIPLWLNVKTFTSFGMRLEGGEFLWVAFTNRLNIF